MRTAVINSANVLQRLTRSGGKESFSFLKNYLSLSLRRKLHVAAAPYSTTSVYSTRGSYSATSTVIYCLTRRHSVAHPRTFQSLLLSRCMTTGNRSSPNTANTVRYIVATAIAVLGLSYAAVPLYRLFCQASGYGGTVTQVDPGEKVEKMEPDRERTLVVRFNADTSAGMRWQFKPQQREITVVPGETALAFYTAENPTDRPVTGISTYNVVPFEAGQYFNKIQCFCFEEQILNPNEQVDMPVFFYIDPEFSEDPAMARVTNITLSYTFFEAKEGESIYLPLSPSHHRQ